MPKKTKNLCKNDSSQSFYLNFDNYSQKTYRATELLTREKKSFAVLEK